MLVVIGHNLTKLILINIFNYIAFIMGDIIKHVIRFIFYNIKLLNHLF